MSLVSQDVDAIAAITGAVEVAVTVVLLVRLEVLLTMEVEVKEVLALLVEVTDLELLVLFDTVELAVVLDVVCVILDVVEPELLDVLLVVVLAGGPAARAVAFRQG